jgi:hypothetical protein
MTGVAYKELEVRVRNSGLPQADQDDILRRLRAGEKLEGGMGTYPEGIMTAYNRALEEATGSDNASLPPTDPNTPTSLPPTDPNTPTSLPPTGPNTPTDPLPGDGGDDEP